MPMGSNAQEDESKRTGPEARRPSVEILEEAIFNISGPRNVAYGPPTKNFQDTADLWNVLLSRRLAPGERFSASDVALAMTGLKLARLLNDRSDAARDSWSDGAAYLALGRECAAAEESEVER